MPSKPEDISQAALAAIQALKRQSKDSSPSVIDPTREILWNARTALGDNLLAQAGMVIGLLESVSRAPQGAERVAGLELLHEACLELAIASSSIVESLSPKQGEVLMERLFTARQTLDRLRNATDLPSKD